MPQPIPATKHGHTIEYKSRLAHLDEPKDDIYQPQADQPQDDQPQADAPADIEEFTEELKDDLEELKDDPLIESEKINLLKHTYQDV